MSRVRNYIIRLAWMYMRFLETDGFGEGNILYLSFEIYSMDLECSSLEDDRPVMKE